jgi:1,2-diacylglycerol 3-beta-galactosyltransferase
MTKKKFVLILTADAGFGHRSAANAIAAALQEAHSRDCDYEIANVLDDPQTPRWLRDSQADYDRLARDLPDLYKFGYKATDATTPKMMIESSMQTMLYRSIRGLLLEKKPDVIVSTYPLYQAPLGAVFSLTKKFIPLVSVVTDLVSVHQIWFNEYPDLIVLPTERVRRVAKISKVSADRMEVIGVPIHPYYSQEKRTKAEIRSELGWEKDRTTILLVGSRRSQPYIEAAHVLNHSGLPIQLVLVTGGDDKSFTGLSETDWHCPAYIYNFTENMPMIMRAADCIICKAGGLIVTESVACGLPMILTEVIPGQETGNAEYVIKAGAGEIVKKPIDILETICHWLLDDGKRLRQLSINAAKLGRPRAAFDIVDRVWKLAQRGPIMKEASQILALPRLIELFKRFGVKEGGT